MASPSRLMAVGVSGPQAVVVGMLPVSVTAAGTTTAAATLLSPNTTVFITTGAGSDSVRLPSANPGDRIETINVTATTAQIFPPTGGTIDSGSTDTAVTSAQNKARIFVCRTPTTWVCVSVVA